MKVLFLFIIFLSTAQAFTLNNNFGGSFGKNKVNVLVAGNSTCANIGLSVYELHDLIAPAVDNFWNKVPTSALRLKAGGFSDAIPNIYSGRLCSPTDTTCISDAGANLIPAVSEIVISCNVEAHNFGNTNVLAVTIPNNFSGKKINGAVILINDMANTVFATLSRQDKIAVLAHEIGHAIGLGHPPSKHSEALMYYKTVDLRRNLAQDDMDGVSYLYPVHFDACGLFGTIDVDKQVPPFIGLSLGFASVWMLVRILRLLKRPQARSAA